MTDPNETLKTHKPNGYGLDTVDNLTKREYFAAMALQGILANMNPRLEKIISNEGKTIPDMAVDCADGLIRALNETKGE